MARLQSIQSTKLRQLLKHAAKPEIEVLPVIVPTYSKEDLVKHELFETIKHGFWPVKFLELQQHWMANGEPVDEYGDTQLAGEDPICGYHFDCTINDDIVIHLSLFQGDVVDYNTTTLVFGCYTMSPKNGDTVHKEEYSINGIAQLDFIIETHWAKFIDTVWPMVTEKLHAFVEYNSTRCVDRDSEIHLDLVKFTWDRFNHKLKQDLTDCQFYDWSALDTIEEWIK